MLFLKRIVTVLALVYLLLALLILFFPASFATSTVGIFSQGAYSLPRWSVNMLLGFSWASVAVSRPCCCW